MSVYDKLLKIQSELKAPKGQYNSFGKYYYRSCEDILEAVKPLCAKNNAVLKISDEIVEVGGRCYVRATATLTDVETAEKETNTAFAREDENKKGMDGSQITGASSSYARKYCLSGLFAIDDTKDADGLPPNEQKADVQELRKLAKIKGYTEERIAKGYKVDSLAKLTEQQLRHAIEYLKKQEDSI